jgi:hypothetical protein
VLEESHRILWVRRRGVGTLPRRPPARTPSRGQYDGGRAAHGPLRDERSGGYITGIASYTSTFPPFANTGQPFARSLAASMLSAVSTE